MFAVPANFDGIFQSRKLARLVLDTWLKLQCGQSWLHPWCDLKAADPQYEGSADWDGAKYEADDDCSVV
jgi:hypothetical protein